MFSTQPQPWPHTLQNLTQASSEDPKTADQSPAAPENDAETSTTALASDSAADKSEQKEDPGVTSNRFAIA